MKKLMLLLFYFGFICAVHAYELNGTMNDNSDGTYTVYLSSDDGDEYTGMATMQGDGTLTVGVAIIGRGNETYIGIATPLENGDYALKLRNDASGNIATGILSWSGA